MPDVFLWSLIFLITLVTLIISADFFIKAAEKIGLALGIPTFVIGVTLIAIGTSLPELVTSLVAVTKSAQDSNIVLGNVVGSNVTNICLILGIVGFLGRKVEIKFDVMRVDIPMLLGAAFILFLMVKDGDFAVYEGIICIIGMFSYLAYVFRLGKANKQNPMLNTEVEEETGSFSWKEILILVASATVIYFSGKYNVNSIERLARIFEVGEEFIALSALSLGTSLPELVVSIVAVRTGNGEMAVGNVVGSNIFNVFAVMGIPRMFGVIEVPEYILGFSLPAMLVVSVILFLVLLDKVISRWEGLLLLLFYALFMGNLVIDQF